MYAGRVTESKKDSILCAVTAMVARPRKRKSRRASGADDKEEGAASPENEAGGAGDPTADTCPACDSEKEAVDKAVWVLCDQCKTWYHWFCTPHGGSGLG